MPAMMTGLGVALGGAGAFLKGSAGDEMRDRLIGAANLPGLNTDQITADALASMGKNLPAGIDLSSRISTANQAQLLAREEQALPGTGAARTAELASILPLLSGRLPPDVANEVMRAASASNLGLGIGGSQMGQFNTARQLGLTSLNAIGMGSGLLSGLLGTMRLANTPGVQSFTGPDPMQLIGIRAQERARQQALLAEAAGVPGMTAAFGNYLSNVGGLAAGSGMFAGSLGGFGAASAGGGDTLGSNSMTDWSTGTPTTYNFTNAGVPAWSLAPGQ